MEVLHKTAEDLQGSPAQTLLHTSTGRKVKIFRVYEPMTAILRDGMLHFFTMICIVIRSLTLAIPSFDVHRDISFDKADSEIITDDP